MRKYIHNPYSDEPCRRCGSKKWIVRMEDEILDSYTGSGSVLHITEVVCTNAECQRLFEKGLAEEQKKRAEARQAKEEQERLRRENTARNLADRLRAAKAL